MKIVSRLMMVVMVVMLASWLLSTGCSKDGGVGVAPDLGDVTGPGEEIEPPDIASVEDIPPEETPETPAILFQGQPLYALFQGQFVKKLTGGFGDEANALFGYSVSISGDRLMVGQPHKDSPDGDAGAGAAYIYKNDGGWSGEWSEIFDWGTLTNIHGGHSVSISGDNAIVGIPHRSDSSSSVFDVGAVILYKHDGTSWGSPQERWASDLHEDDEFGASVSMHGDYAIVGAPYKENAPFSVRGAAYIFKLDGGSWVEDTKTGLGTFPSDNEFGYSVAIHGDSAIIGAPQYSTGKKGKARIYIRDNSDVWNGGVSFVPAGISSDAMFGFSVAIGEKYAVVGAPYDDHVKDNAGAAIVYERVGDEWVEKLKLYSNSPKQNALFGASVAVSGDYIVVGAPEEYSFSSKAGAVYVFRHDGADWGTPKRIDAAVAGDIEEDAGFGSSVAIDGTTVVVGARKKDGGAGADAGAVYIFK